MVASSRLERRRRSHLTPASRFVAEFIGSSNPMLGGLTAFTDGVAALVTANGLRLNVRCERSPSGATVTALIRPERVQILTAQHQRNDGLVAEIRSLIYLGEDVQFQVLVDGRETMLIYEGAECGHSAGGGRTADDSDRCRRCLRHSALTQ